jgi:formate-dependent nitrite reductase membrane component NrfD
MKHGTLFPAAFTGGTRWAFWVTVGIAIVGLLATIVLIRDKEMAMAEDAVAAPG